MSKQTALKVGKDHLNYLVHLQQRQDDPSITKTLSSVINDQMDDDPEWQHMQYLEDLRDGNK